MGFWPFGAPKARWLANPMSRHNPLFLQPLKAHVRVLSVSRNAIPGAFPLPEYARFLPFSPFQRVPCPAGEPLGERLRGVIYRQDER